MNEADRTKRDRAIEALFLAGNRPLHIAQLYGLNAERVRRILKERGHKFEHASGYDDPNSIWALPEWQLREAIWERQREGARQALKGLSPTIHNIHTNENKMSA